MTDFPDWQAPQAHATAIAATGVPLLTSSAVLNESTNFVGAGNNHTLGPFAVSQIGYEIEITGTIAAGATSPFCIIVLNWFDVASGALIASDSFSALCGTATDTNFVTVARGPSKGDQVNVTIYNTDGSDTATVSVVLLQNSRVYTSDRVYWLNLYPDTLVVPAFTLAKQMPDESVLGVVTSGAVAASASPAWLCGIGYGGPVNLAGNTATIAASSLTITCFAQPSSVYGAGAILLRQALSAAAFDFTFYAPKCPFTVQVTNASTVAGTVSFMATVSR